MAVTSSGREVPSATNVRAMTLSGTPMACAIRVPLSTSRLAPHGDQRRAEQSSRIRVLGRDINSSSPARCSARARSSSACTLATM